MRTKHNYKSKHDETQKLIALKKYMFFSCVDLSLLLGKPNTQIHRMLVGKAVLSKSCKERLDFYEKAVKGNVTKLYGLPLHKIRAGILTIPLQYKKNMIVHKLIDELDEWYEEKNND